MMMLYRSFEVDEDLGCVYGIEDIQALKCANASNAKDLKTFNANFRRLRLGLMDPWKEQNETNLATLEYYYWKQIKGCNLELLKDELRAYRKAKKGDSEKSLKFLVESVENCLKKMQLETNRADQLKGSSGTASPAKTKGKGKEKGKDKGKANKEQEENKDSKGEKGKDKKGKGKGKG